MQEAVEEAILAERSDDKVLVKLLEITIKSINDDRPIFGILDEPVLYRMFREWTVEGIRFAKELKKEHDDALEKSVNR